VNFIAMHYYQLLGGMIASFILRGLPVILIFLPLLWMHAALSAPLYIAYALAAVVLGHFMYIIMYAIIGFMAFTFLEIWPFNRLMNDTIRFLSGSFIPLALFPGWLGALAHALPFRFLYSFPLELLLGRADPSAIATNFGILLVWLAALGALLLLTYKRAINKCTVQGG
jgi:ABC-2 type transport system permease protein